jgi:SAM-dependent methyltransferase
VLAGFECVDFKRRLDVYIVDRTKNFVQGFLASYGPSSIKKRLWDKDFSGDKWAFIDNTVGDCVYPHLEKHARNGNILDLGCGPGNTANELDASVYDKYVGVDISEVALAKAAKRTQENGRTEKNSFVCSDFLGYQPTQEFDIILFRESLYHVPYGQVLKILEKYSKHLKKSGVFIVRLYLGDNRPGKIKFRVKRKIDLIKRKFEVLESPQYDTKGLPTVVVFRPRPQS